MEIVVRLVLLVLPALLVLAALLAQQVRRELRALRGDAALLDRQAHRVQADLVDLRVTLERAIADLTVPVTPAPATTPARDMVKADRKGRTGK